MPAYPKERFHTLVNQIPEKIKETIFCFSGEPYLCEEAAKQIITKIKKKNVIIEYVFGDEIEQASFKEKLLSASLFGEEKIIWIKYLTRFSFLSPKIIHHLQHYLVITTLEAKAIPDFIKKEAIFVDFSVKPKEQQRWQEQLIQTVLKKAKKRITPTAKTYLLDYTGFNLFALKNYLEMLINYIGEKEIINEQHIINMVTPIKEEAAFAIGEKLEQNKTEIALRFLKNLVEQGFHPLAILSVLIKECRSLLEAKILLEEGKINFNASYSYQQFLKTIYPEVKRKKLTILINLHPYVLYIILKRANRYSLRGLYRIHEKLLLTDSFIKTSTQNSLYYLETLILFWVKCLGGKND